MNILAIDIGTTTGWALSTRGGAMKGGSESFAPKRSEGMGQRWLKFRLWLNNTRASVDEINVVYYERATQLPNQHSAAHIYGGFLAMIEVWAEVNNVRLVAVSPMTIKKFWTGTGRAKKADMIAMAKAKGLNPVDDNHCDAMALLAYALAQEGDDPLREPELRSVPPAPLFVATA